MIEYIGLLTGLGVMSFLINLSAGYMRGRTRKYSMKWFFYIHFPVPFIAMARIFSHVEIKFIPLFVLLSIAGQIMGSRLRFRV